MKFSKLTSVMLASSIVLALGANALADPLVIVVPNPSGNGVSVYTNATITDLEYAILTGIDAPPEAPGQTVLFLEEGAPPRWTNDTIGEIDRRHRGDGSPPMQDLSKIPFQNNDVIELIDDIAPNAPREIFDDDDDDTGEDRKSGDDDGLSNISGEIALKDGNWNRIAGHTGFEGCGPTLPGQVHSILPRFPDETRNMTFSTPFNPHTDLGFDSQILILWSQTSPNEWVGNVELPTAGSAQAGIEFGITLELELLSNTEMEMYSNVIVRLSEFTANILESSKLCTATSNMTLRYIGG